MNDRKTISIMKACELVGVSRRTIYNWIASGKVEYIRTAGGSVRIFVDTLWREPGTRRPDQQRSVMMPAADVTPGSARTSRRTSGLLFHRLNNQLGIILANAELLEAKLADEISRARARPGRRQRARRDGDRPRDPPARPAHPERSDDAPTF